MSLDVRLPSLMFLAQASRKVILEYPATVLAGVMTFIAWIHLLEDGGQDYARLWMVSQLAVPLFVGATVLARRLDWSALLRYGLQALIAGLLTGYYFSIRLDGSSVDEMSMWRFFGYLVVAHLLVSYLPYLGKGTVMDFWEYNKDLFVHFVVGAVYTVILWGGLSLAILAVNELFDLHIDETIYLKLFFFLSGVFHVWYFLYHFPERLDYAAEDLGYSRVFRNLVRYILIPIVVLYFLILYVYAAKILLNWSLPRGWVSSLVLGFSIAGIFTYLLGYLLPKTEMSPFVRGFYRRFWVVLAPMVVLLFVAIGTRIADYGVTEARFVVAHAGVWLALVCLYFLFFKKPDIRFIPVSLSLFSLVAVVGPLNAFLVAQRSQVSELRELLVKNNRWENGKIKTSLLAVGEEDADRIRSSVQYLETHDALWRIAPWFDQPLDSLPKIGFSKSLTPRILSALRVQRKEIEAEATIYVSPNANVSSGNIRGYETFYRVDLNKYATPPGSGNYFALDPEGKGIVYREKRGTRELDIEFFDLMPQMKNWLDKSEYNAYYLEEGEETIDFDGEQIELRLVVLNLSFVSQGDTGELSSLSGLIFIKDKR